MEGKLPVKTSSAMTSATRGFWDGDVFPWAEPGLRLWGPGGAESWRARCMSQPRSQAQPLCHLPGFFLPACPK